MTKRKVQTQPVNRKLFKAIVTKKGWSVRKLGSDPRISASDKTIRRCLKKGVMRTEYIEEIARVIDVDKRMLTGKIYYMVGNKKAFPIRYINEYPYSREELDALKNEERKETLSRVLSVFNRSYSQYEEKTSLVQMHFQEELFKAIEPVIYKYFEANVYGNINDYGDQFIFHELESAIEYYETIQMADTTIRQSYIDNPPDGYSKKQIEKMIPEDILNLYYSINNLEINPGIDIQSIRKELMENPPEGYTKEEIERIPERQLEDLYFFGFS